MGQIPAWVPIIVVGRDLAVDGLRMVAASQNIVMAAGWSGKIKTAVTMVGICVMIVFHDVNAVNIVCYGLIVLLNIVSLIDYFHANGKVLLDTK
jgi:CDP-diacylglycerol--glycerol-3-phosphate 3-phosphatidyltransferase